MLQRVRGTAVHLRLASVARSLISFQTKTDLPLDPAIPQLLHPDCVDYRCTSGSMPSTSVFESNNVAWQGSRCRTAGACQFPQLINLRRFGSTGSTHAARKCQSERLYHCGRISQFVGLGIVDQLHDDPAIQLPVTGSRNLWEVLEFHPDATVLETYKTPDVLNLHPRDVYLFASDSASGQHSTILSRNDAILFKTEVLKAIIYRDKAVLFPSRRTQDTLRNAQALKSALCQKSPLPFELKVLEALLSETCRAFESKSRRLAMVAETVLNDINAAFQNSAGELQRLLPIQRKLMEVQNDIKETLDAIGDVANYDDTLRSICVTERYQRITAAAKVQQGERESEADLEGEGCISVAAPVPGARGEGGRPLLTRDRPRDSPHSMHMRMASAILESYEFKMLGTHGALKEMLDNLEQTRTVWHMQLDHQRNRVLRINLLISVLSLGIVVSTAPAAYFGMNLVSGWEDTPGAFWPVIYSSLATGAASGAGFWMFFKFGPKRRYYAKLRDMRSLRDLLMYHIDDLEEIISCVRQKGRVDRREFEVLVKEAVKGRPMSQDEVSLLYRVFDTNKDGFLEISELVRLEDHMAEQLSKLPGPPGDDLM